MFNYLRVAVRTTSRFLPTLALSSSSFRFIEYYHNAIFIELRIEYFSRETPIDSLFD